LRKSFVKNDKRYEAQFWYARTLYLLGEDEFSEFFDYLKGVPLDIRKKREPLGLVTENRIPKIFEGTIIKLERSYGFLKQDFSGESIYFYRSNDNCDIRFNSRVKFNKAFNYSGPIAILLS
jgi:hypothetical protein